MKTLAFTVAGALGLKLWLRDAGVEQLQWLLKPTVLLSEVLSQTPFRFEAGVGYLDPTQTFQVVPACSGLNFFCIAVVSAVALFGQRVVSQALLVATSVVGAFALTVLANALRITLAMAVHLHHVSFGWLTAPRLHEAIGVLVYLSMLVLATQLLNRRVPA